MTRNYPQLHCYFLFTTQFWFSLTRPYFTRIMVSLASFMNKPWWCDAVHSLQGRRSRGCHASPPTFFRSFNNPTPSGKGRKYPLDFHTFLRPCTAKPVASHLYAESFPSNTCITNDQKLIVMHEFETNQHSVNSLHTLNLFVMCTCVIM